MTEIRSDGIFVSNTLPDINPKSHVVGIVGTHDHDSSASPDEDGWFLSDFYLFNHLLAGLCQTQAWYTCLHPQKLVDKYGEYAHGNPYQTRCIVLDKEKLDGEETPQDLVVVREEELLENFLRGLRAECQAAHAAGDPVLMFVFGHGDGWSHGVEIGRLPSGETAMLSLDTIQALLRDFSGLHLSAVFTSCFSGGWTTHVNMTAMAAAGATKLSESWPEFESCGRSTGSIFASAIVERLRNEDMQIDPDVAKETSYQEFTDDVKAKLMLLDKFGSQHEIQFSAQDDQWQTEYHARTGIPRAKFQDRLQLLRTIPSTDRNAHPFGDRTSEEQLRIWGQPSTDTSSSASVTTLKGSMRGRHGGSKNSIQSMMKSRVANYLDSYPTRSSLAPNHAVARLANKCLKDQCCFEELDRLAGILDYREKAMRVAAALVRVLGLEPFPPHWRWDLHEWQEKPEIKKRLESTPSPLRLIFDARLIPKPGKNEGHPSPKPENYLCAAMLARDLSNDEIVKKIKEAQDWLEKQITLATKQVAASMTMRGRKDTWAQTFKARLRSISPRKIRQSLGSTAA